MRIERSPASAERPPEQLSPPRKQLAPYWIPERPSRIQTRRRAFRSAPEKNSMIRGSSSTRAAASTPTTAILRRDSFIMVNAKRRLAAVAARDSHAASHQQNLCGTNRGAAVLESRNRQSLHRRPAREWRKARNRHRLAPQTRLRADRRFPSARR